MSKLIFTIICICMFFTAFAQLPPVTNITWNERYGGRAGDKGVAFVKTPDNGYMTLGTTSSDDGTYDVTGYRDSYDLWVTKLDANRNLVWNRCYGGTDQDHAVTIIAAHDGNYFLVGFTNSNDIDVDTSYNAGFDIWLVKINPAGDILWSKNYGGSAVQKPYGAQLVDGNSVLIWGYDDYGSSPTANIDIQNPIGMSDGWVFKIDSVGDIIWERSIGGTRNDYIYDMDIMSDGNYILSGATSSMDGDVTTWYGVFDVWLVKMDPQGNILWQKSYGGSGYEHGYQVEFTDNDQIVIGAYTNSTDGHVVNNDGAAEAWIVKTDINGNMLWEYTYGGFYDETFRGAGQALKVRSNGEIVFVCQTVSNDGDVSGYMGSGDVWLVRLDDSGNIIWKRNFGGSSSDIPSSIEIENDSLVTFIGSSWSRDFDLEHVFYVPPATNNGCGGICSDQWMFQLNIDFEYAVIRGRVYHDVNQNCVFDTAIDRGLDHWFIDAPNTVNTNNATYNGGNYALYALNTGLNEWGLTIPQHLLPLVDMPCDTLLTLYIDSLNTDTSGFNFGIQMYACPLMSVTVGTDRRRPCFASTTTVSYCNDGSTTAQNVEVVVELPIYATPASASESYTINRQGQIVFALGSIAAGACGEITITDTTDCDLSLTGLETCTQAWILPSNDCYNALLNPVSAWDMSDLSVSASCSSTSQTANFTIYNYGQDMQMPQQYRVLGQNGLIYSDSVQLAAGDSLEISLTGVGYYVRLEVDNHPDRPTTPAVFAELGDCPTGVRPQFFVVPYETFDDNVATDVECIVIVNSYDPNDKQVAPLGILAQHYVTSNSMLEYKIRFQNTGTDTAYRVEVIDTLSEHIDLASLQLGSASHAYEFYVDGANTPVFHWVFNDINLVDSLTNEPASHGHLKFKVAMKKGLAEETTITNFADIYFDYNDPIRTNSPFVTLKDNWPSSLEDPTIVINGDTLGIVGSVPLLADHLTSLYPNPITDELIIDLPPNTNSKVQIEIYDLYGERVAVKQLNGTTTTLPLDLPNGIYMYRLNFNNRIESGKIIVAR